MRVASPNASTPCFVTDCLPWLTRRGRYPRGTSPMPDKPTWARSSSPAPTRSRHGRGWRARQGYLRPLSMSGSYTPIGVRDTALAVRRIDSLAVVREAQPLRDLAGRLVVRRDPGDEGHVRVERGGRRLRRARQLGGEAVPLL